MEFSIKNPLSALFTTTEGKYDFEHLVYPLKYENALNQGHYMRFYINSHEDSAYFEKGKSSSLVKTSGRNAANSFNSYSIPSSSGLFGIKGLGGDEIKTRFTGIKDSLTSDDRDFASVNKQKLYKRINKAISLYMPSGSLIYNTETDWQQDSLSARFGKFWNALKFGQDVGNLYLSAADQQRASIKDFSWKTTSGENRFLASAGAQLASDVFGINAGSGNFFLGASGFAVNPDYLVLYKSIGRREFRFSFIFAPSNLEETRNIKNIIKMFRFHSSPEVYLTSGYYHLSPATWDIRFFHKGKENNNIPKISTCALTNVSVDYSSKGWSTFVDGMPVITLLNLTFSEMSLITKQKIEEGF